MYSTTWRYQITADIYAHVTRKASREADNKLEKFPPSSLSPICLQEMKKVTRQSDLVSQKPVYINVIMVEAMGVEPTTS